MPKTLAQNDESNRLSPVMIVAFIMTLGDREYFLADGVLIHKAFWKIQEENKGSLPGGFFLGFRRTGDYPYSRRLEELIGTLIHTNVLVLYHPLQRPRYRYTNKGVLELLREVCPDPATVEAIRSASQRFVELVSEA